MQGTSGAILGVQLGAIAMGAAGASAPFEYRFFDFDDQGGAPVPLIAQNDPRGVRLHADHAALASLRALGVEAAIPIAHTRNLSLTELPLGAVELDESIARWFGSEEPGVAALLERGPVRFNLDRNTELTDGGIRRESDPIGVEGVASLTQGEGEYTLTDLEMHWRAAGGGPLELRFVSGVTTIEADVRARTHGNDVHEVHSRVVPVPTFGSALRWEINDGWSITSRALTQSIDLGSSFVDFSARSDWRLSDRIDLSAGYQIIRSSFEVDSLASDLTQEGIFARVQIKF